jgi:hypothetical protein
LTGSKWNSETLSAFKKQLISLLEALFSEAEDGTIVFAPGIK